MQKSELLDLKVSGRVRVRWAEARVTGRRRRRRM